jgi:hypothetical protein
MSGEIEVLEDRVDEFCYELALALRDILDLEEEDDEEEDD